MIEYVPQHSINGRLIILTNLYSEFLQMISRLAELKRNTFEAFRFCNIKGLAPMTDGEASIDQLISMKAHALLARSREISGSLSMEKVSDWLSIQLLTLWRERPSYLLPPDPRRLKYEKRSRLNHWQAMTYFLA